MSTFLMVAVTPRDLRCWQTDWLAMNTPNVAAHDAARKLTTMRNGDVYLWRRLEPGELYGLEVSAVFCYENFYPKTQGQWEAMEILRTRVR